MMVPVGGFGGGEGPGGMYRGRSGPGGMYRGGSREASRWAVESKPWLWGRRGRRGKRAGGQALGQTIIVVGGRWGKEGRGQQGVASSDEGPRAKGGHIVDVLGGRWKECSHDEYVSCDVVGSICKAPPEAHGFVVGPIRVENSQTAAKPTSVPLQRPCHCPASPLCGRPAGSGAWQQALEQGGGEGPGG